MSWCVHTLHISKLWFTTHQFTRKCFKFLMLHSIPIILPRGDTTQLHPPPRLASNGDERKDASSSFLLVVVNCVALIYFPTHPLFRRPVTQKVFFFLSPPSVLTGNEWCNPPHYHWMGLNKDLQWETCVLPTKKQEEEEEEAMESLSGMGKERTTPCDTQK